MYFFTDGRRPVPYVAAVRAAIGYAVLVPVMWPAFAAMLRRPGGPADSGHRLAEAFVPALAWPFMLPLIVAVRLATSPRPPRARAPRAPGLRVGGDR